MLLHHLIGTKLPKERSHINQKIVVMKDVPTMKSEEELAFGMVPRRRKRVTNMKDVLTKQRREECVSDMVPRRRKRLAAMRVY